MGWIIAISNQKGGVGKTTTCISLGACLAENGYKTLIVDIDSQSNLTMAVGLNPEALDLALTDLIEKDHKTTSTIDPSIIKHTSVANLDILPSDLRLASTERLLYETPDYESSLHNALQPLQDTYPYILLDCPPSLGALTLTALTAAHSVLVPVQCEYYSARGLVRLLDVIEAVRNHTNPSLGYHLVVTLFDKRNKISKLVYDQLYDNFGDYFFTSIIGIDTKLRESQVVGEPITQYAPRSRSSKNYQQLAKEIIANYNPKGVRDEKAE